MNAHAENTVVSQKQNRKIYKYSVIPGGVYTGEELGRARRLDRVVEAHYADFDLNAAHLLQLSRDQLVYVSYRKADKVYWTKGKHRVCAGEAVVTDGKNMARSRCGNRLSATPQLPVAKSEPSESALNVPLPVPSHLAGPAEPTSLAGPIEPGVAPINSGTVGPVEAMPRSLTGASNPFPSLGATYPPISPVFGAGPIAPSPRTGNNGGGSPISGGTTPGGTTTPGGGTGGGGTTGPGGGTITPITSIPEPGTLFMLFGGSLAWYGIRARRAR